MQPQRSSGERPTGRYEARWNMADLTVRRTDEIMRAYNEKNAESLIDPNELAKLYATTRAWYGEISPLLLIYLGDEQFEEKAQQWKERLGITGFWDIRNLLNSVAELIDNEQYELAHDVLEELGIFFRAVMQEFGILWLIDYKPPRPGVEYQLIQLYGEGYLRALEKVRKEWKEKVIDR